MATREEMYAILGEIAVTFSNLDHNIRRILNLMIDGNHIVGPIITDDLGFHRILSSLREYVKIRLVNVPALGDRIMNLVKEVDEQRIVRNPFVHGQWLMDEKLLVSGRVSCFQYKLRYNKTKQLWEHLHNHRFTLIELREKAITVVRIRDEAIAIGSEVETYIRSLSN